MITAAIVAGGKGERMGSVLPKQFLKIGDREIIIHTLEKFISCKKIDRVAVGINPDYYDYAEKLFERYFGKDRKERERRRDSMMLAQERERMARMDSLISASQRRALEKNDSVTVKKETVERDEDEPIDKDEEVKRDIEIAEQKSETVENEIIAEDKKDKKAKKEKKEKKRKQKKNKKNNEDNDENAK